MSRVMVVDDEAIITTQLKKSLRSLGHKAVGEASSGEEAVEKAKQLRPDVILMDIVMPEGLDGIAASETIKKELDIPVIFLTAYGNDEFIQRAKKVGPFGYILKPFEEVEVKAAIEIALHKKDAERSLEKELNRALKALEKTAENTTSILLRIMEAKIPLVAHHQEHVAQLALAITKEMGLSEEKMRAVHAAARIHDVGEIFIPFELINKPRRLTEVELNMVRTHPQAGCDILRQAGFPAPLAQIVLQHHERMDGSGYPQSLSGKEIMLEARILEVADVVGAMSFYRPYRPAHILDKVMQEIWENKGKLYDAHVVDACSKLFVEKGFKFK